MEVETAMVGVHQPERGAGDVVGDTQRPTEALCQRRLPRTQLTHQQDEVVGASQLGHGCTQGAGVVSGIGMCDQVVSHRAEPTEPMWSHLPKLLR